MARNGNRGHKGQAAFFLALAAGDCIKEAGAKAGLSERQAHRRFREPETMGRVAELRAEMITRAAAKLADAATAAADRLRNLLEAESESVRLAAAKALLELAFKSRELCDWETRLSELERKIGHATCETISES